MRAVKEKKEIKLEWKTLLFSLRFFFKFLLLFFALLKSFIYSYSVYVFISIFVKFNIINFSFNLVLTDLCWDCLICLLVLIEFWGFWGLWWKACLKSSSFSITFPLVVRNLFFRVLDGSAGLRFPLLLLISSP